METVNFEINGYYYHNGHWHFSIFSRVSRNYLEFINVGSQNILLKYNFQFFLFYMLTPDSETTAAPKYENWMVR